MCWTYHALGIFKIRWFYKNFNIRNMVLATGIFKALKHILLYPWDWCWWQHSSSLRARFSTKITSKNVTKWPWRINMRNQLNLEIMAFLKLEKKRKVGETVLHDLVGLLDFQLKSNLKMLRNVNDVLIFGGHSWCFRSIAHFKWQFTVAMWKLLSPIWILKISISKKL